MGKYSILVTLLLRTHESSYPAFAKCSTLARDLDATLRKSFTAPELTQLMETIKSVDRKSCGIVLDSAFSRLASTQQISLLNAAVNVLEQYEKSNARKLMLQTKRKRRDTQQKRRDSEIKKKAKREQEPAKLLKTTAEAGNSGASTCHATLFKRKTKKHTCEPRSIPATIKTLLTELTRVANPESFYAGQKIVQLNRLIGSLAKIEGYEYLQDVSTAALITALLDKDKCFTYKNIAPAVKLFEEASLNYSLGPPPIAVN